MRTTPKVAIYYVYWRGGGGGVFSKEESHRIFQKIQFVYF